jgi:acyl-[acyl carrier protein]--UDP-N-acetylglucosamine O-acyltransferase
LSYVGINSVGLRRRGFTTEKIREIQDIYRILSKNYNTTHFTWNHEAEMEATPERDEIIDFIRNSEGNERIFWELLKNKVISVTKNKIVIKTNNIMASTSDIKTDCVLNTTMIFTKSLNFFTLNQERSAFVRTKLRSLTNGKVLDNTFLQGIKSKLE